MLHGGLWLTDAKKLRIDFFARKYQILTSMSGIKNNHGPGIFVKGDSATHNISEVRTM